MNVLTDDIFRVYRKFLFAAFGSAMLSSIYTLVDAAVVGQYHGPLGVAAMAVIAPVWNVLFSLGLLAGPEAFVKVFMKPTDSVLAVAPGIVRTYALAFVFLPFNVFATYYFQATLKPKVSFAISISRGLLVSGALILVLPCLFGGQALWWAIPLAEVAVAAYAVASLRQKTLV